MKALAALFIMFTIAGAGSAATGTSVSPADPLGGVVTADVDAMLPTSYRNPRSSQAAVSWALSQVGVPRDSGHCLRFVNLAYGRPSGPPSAHLVWTQGPPELRRTSGTPPQGAVVVWSSAIGGGHGHIGISLGDGRMVSTTDSVIEVLPIQGFADSAYLGWMPPYFYM